MAEAQGNSAISAGQERKIEVRCFRESDKLARIDQPLHTRFFKPCVSAEWPEV